MKGWLVLNHAFSVSDILAVGLLLTDKPEDGGGVGIDCSGGLIAVGIIDKQPTGFSIGRGHLNRDILG